jgi:hypothetical protein
VTRLLAPDHEITFAHRGNDAAVAHRRLDNRNAVRTSARRSPRFDITVTAIASLRSSRVVQSTASIVMI